MKTFGEFAKLPLLITMPAFCVGIAFVIWFEFNTISLSAKLISSVFIVVTVPLTVKLPLIVKSLEIVPPVLGRKVVSA